MMIPNIKAKAVSAGGCHLLILDLNNNVWVCGGNKFGQLGLGDYNNRNIMTILPNLKCKQISAKADHSIIINLYGDIFIFGKIERHIDSNAQVLLYNIPTQISNFQAKEQASAASGEKYSVIIGNYI